MKICVYGASSNEIDKEYIKKTEELGELIAERGHSLVYGGGAKGLMGAVARGVHRGGGEILGVAPSFFDVDGVLFDKCTEFIYTDTMRNRKQIMEENADAFIVTPGGLGTFEEFFEILTLKQLSRHNKPVVLFNILGYYDFVDNVVDVAIGKKFMKENCKKLYEVFDNIDDLVSYIENYREDEKTVDFYKNI